MPKTFSQKDRKDFRYSETGNPYHEYKKYPEPAVCKVCGLVYMNGRWTVKTLTKAVKSEETCPACRIIKDRVPLGVAVFEGAFLTDENKKEIKNIFKNIEKQVREKRPLQRIMSIEDRNNIITIYTTYDHLARRLGESVYKACKGDLTIKYVGGEKFSRVHWRRD